MFGFLDVVFHAAALVVEAPQIDRFPFQIGDDRFVLPVGIEHQRSWPSSTICALRIIATRRGFFQDVAL